MAATNPNIDWTVVQALYLQGVKLSTIADQTGANPVAIRSRARRLNWRSSALQVQSNIAQSARLALIQQSEATKRALGSVITKSAQVLERVQINSKGEACRINADMEPVVRNAKVVFGWRDEETKPIVNIGTLQSITLNTEPAPVPVQDQDQTKTIDLPKD